MTIPKHLSTALFSGGRTAERICNFLIFSLTPTGLFWFWFLTDVRHEIPEKLSDLHIAMPLAALWITLAPLLMQQSEYMERDIIEAFNREGPINGWAMADIQRKLHSADRLYYKLVTPLAISAPVALALSLPSLRSVISVDSTWKYVAGVVVIFQVGFTSATGLWGVIKAMMAVPLAVRTVRLRWSAFRSSISPLADLTYSSLQKFGVMFSLGALFVPALYVVRIELNPVAQVVVFTFSAFLLFGGLCFFAVPAIFFSRMMERHKLEVLDRLAPPIESILEKLQRINTLSTDEAIHLNYSLKALLQARSEMASQSSLPPSFRLLARSATTLILPIAIALIQLFGSKD
ncbi:hypothetical protein [Streptomyces sp. NBC_01304]|uniref:hypothetical protein n=1 Tax=Streptomyces sp. NBC_01304 TaxID=2903818 RepID=UPI002E0EEE69|nr:hypothetical protein OG430_42490 [Streptomyces sp. NBC_01304]